MKYPIFGFFLCIFQNFLCIFHLAWGTPKSSNIQLTCATAEKVSFLCLFILGMLAFPGTQAIAARFVEPPNQLGYAGFAGHRPVKPV